MSLNDSTATHCPSLLFNRSPAERAPAFVQPLPSNVEWVLVRCADRLPADAQLHDPREALEHLFHPPRGDRSVRVVLGGGKNHVADLELFDRLGAVRGQKRRAGRETTVVEADVDAHDREADRRIARIHADMGKKVRDAVHPAILSHDCLHIEI